MDNFMFSDYASMFNIDPDSIKEFNNYMKNYYNGILQNYYSQLGSGLNMFKQNPAMLGNILNSSTQSGFQG